MFAPDNHIGRGRHDYGVWHEIHARHKLKEPKKSIARELGLDVRTVWRILRQKEPQAYKRRKQKSP